MATSDVANTGGQQRKGWPRWLKILTIAWAVPVGLIVVVVIIGGMVGGSDDATAEPTARPVPPTVEAPTEAASEPARNRRVDTGKWRYREITDEMTNEIGLRYLSITSNERIDRTLKTPIRVELLSTCPQKLIVLRAEDAVFHMDELDSNGRRIQESRFIVDDGSAREARWQLPESILESDRLFGGRWGDTLLTGSVLKIEIRYVVVVDVKKTVLTFDTAGWQAAFEENCPVAG